MFDPEFGEIPDEIIALALVEDEVESIPDRLDEMEPGPFLATILAHTDFARLTGYDRIKVLRAQQRMASHYSAGVYAAMASVTEHLRQEDDDYQLGSEAASAEIRAALRLTRRATEAEHSFALELHERLPAVAAALEAGDIDVRRAKTIARHTEHLSTATTQEVVDQVIGEAPNLTTGQLAARLKRLCIEANPDEAKDRYEHATDQRRVVMDPTVDGTANLLGLHLPPERVAAALRRINDIAKRLRGHGETRTMDQLRADILLDLINGTQRDSKSGHRGVVDIHVDLETLMNLSNKPGELAGYGPVIADIARQTVDQQLDSEWRFTVTHPETGAVLHNGTTRRRPTAAQRRHIESRTRTCIFPGCRMPAIESDLDHTTPHSEGGPTDVANLGPLCRHDHCTKHQHGWTYTPLPNGDYQWTTKLGHTYTTSGTPP